MQTKWEYAGEARRVAPIDGIGQPREDADGVLVHRIRAVRSFGNVRAGDLGGWLADGADLDRDGDAWVYPGGVVLSGRVEGGAALVDGVLLGGVLGGTHKVGGGAAVRGYLLGAGELYGSAVDASVEPGGRLDAYLSQVERLKVAKGGAAVFRLSRARTAGVVEGSLEANRSSLLVCASVPAGTALVLENSIMAGDARPKGRLHLANATVDAGELSTGDVALVAVPPSGDGPWRTATYNRRTEMFSIGGERLGLREMESLCERLSDRDSGAALAFVKSLRT